ncbi:hypothetical protein ABPG74_010399 [Tetrahymena malaccensis]
MARLWWTLDPSKYYLKQISSGGRNEILFTVLGVTAAYWYFGNKRCEHYWRRQIDNCQAWSRAQNSEGSNLTVKQYF